MKTVIFGLGRAAEQIHLPAFAVLPELSLAAGCEPNAERRAAMQAKFNIPAVYADPAEMLERERPELAVIVTPPDTHHDLTMLAIQHGAHVLCEKPFVRNVSEADAVIAAADAAGKMLRVNNQYRYMATYRTPAEQIQRGDYGRAYFIQCWQQMFHPAVDDKTAWRAHLKQSTLYEFGSHSLDLISLYFGALPVAVSAAIPRHPDYDSDVLVQLTLHFPDERIATLGFNRVSRAPERYLEMRVDCEKASLRLSLGGVARAALDIGRYEGRNFPQLRTSFVRGGEARAEINGRSKVIAREPRPAFASATAAHLREMIAAIKAGEINTDRARHAREILRVIFAAYQAAEARAVISLQHGKG